MNNPIPRSQIDSVANRMMQMVLSILPISAAIIALLTQQGLGLKADLMIGAIWLSILTLSISALVNLQIFRFPETQTDEDEKKLNRTYRDGIRWFRTGIFILMISPLTLAAGYWEPRDIPIQIHTDDAEIAHRMPAPTVLYSNASITNLSDSQQALTVNLKTDDGGCITLSPNNFPLTLHAGASQVIGWNMTFTQGCIPGNYLVLIEVLSKTRALHRDYMTIKITP